MSSKKLFLALIAVVLCLAMCVSFASCGGNGSTETTPETKGTDETTPETTAETTAPVLQTRVVNDDTTLIIQESTFDGVFNPFFYSNAYDGDAIGLTMVGLLTVDPTGAVVCGDQYDTVGKSYEIYYTDDLTNYTKKDAYEDGDYVVYEIVVKNGAKFSDGSAVTADDVLFNYYVYLDPAYVGSSTLYTLPILGMTEYRTQTTDVAGGKAVANKIFEAGETYAASADFTEDQFNTYWDGMKQTGIAFATEIATYVAGNYGSDDYVKDYFNPDLDWATVKANENLKAAFGASMWGFGSFDGDGNFIGSGTGKNYGTVETISFTMENYWEELKAAYSDEDGVVDFQTMSDVESAGMDLVASAMDAYLAASAEIGAVPTIAGLVKGTTTIDGEEFETVKIVLTEQNPKAILSLGVTVAPMAYYTAGYEYADGALQNYGVELGIGGNSKFMDHLATLNSNPMGAGPYKFVKADGDGVTFVRNEYHYTMGNENVYNANVKNVYMKVVDSGKEYDALKAGDVHYATVSASANTVAEFAKNENLTQILVDNLGYGYICINPAATEYGLDNLYTRIAYTTVLNLDLVGEYYPSGLADVIYRAQSQVSWAYPENAQAMYAYDETLAAAKEWLQKAGYTLGDDGKFTDVPALDLYIPSNAEDHPAGNIFLKAQENLAKIGVTANIKVDTNLIANIKTNAIPVYALAWSSAQDPDMYQVYHYASAAESVISNGIKWLQANGNNNDKGTIEFVKLGDSEATVMNQSEALTYLGELIELGTKYMSMEERKPIYSTALDLLAKLSIEVPTYQRKNMFGYDNTVVAAASLSSTVTPYWGPLAEIWKVSLADGVNGNKTVEVDITNGDYAG